MNEGTSGGGGPSLIATDTESVASATVQFSIGTDSANNRFDISSSEDNLYFNVSTAYIDGNEIYYEGNEPPTTSNPYLSTLSFNTSDGILTATLSDSSTVTEDLDGRYLISLPSHSHTFPDLPISSTDENNWNQAYNNYITSVSGDGDDTLTLTQRDGGAITANLDHGHSASDVDAVSASNGGTFTDDVAFNSGFVGFNGINIRELSSGDPWITPANGSELRIGPSSSGDTYEAYFNRITRFEVDTGLTINGGSTDFHAPDSSPSGSRLSISSPSGDLGTIYWAGDGSGNQGERWNQRATSSEFIIENNASGHGLTIDTAGNIELTRDINWANGQITSGDNNTSARVIARAINNPSDGDAIFAVESSGGATRFGVTQNNGGWFRNYLRVGYIFDNAGLPSASSALMVDGVSEADDHTDHSDRRLKSDLQHVDPLGIASFAKYRLFNFEKEGLDRRQIGLIAQDMEKADPDLISWGNHKEYGKIRNLSAYSLSSTALAGVGKLHEKQKTQTELISELRNRVAKLEQEKKQLKQKTV